MRQLVACSTLAALLIVAAPSPQCDAHQPALSSQSLFQQNAWFECEGECTAVLIHAIGLARKSILVEGYRIGPRTALSALEQAQAAGIHVQTIRERGRTRYPAATAPQGFQGELRDPNYTVDRPEVLVIDNR